MPAFNAEQYITESVSSVLGQSFRDLELIVIDDGSTDGTASAVQRFSEPRVRLESNGSNLGLAATRNRGLELARGEYIAWLDSDDIALPNRIEAQLRYLARHATVGLCGTAVQTLGLPIEARWRYPRYPRVAAARLLFDNPLSTSAVMGRRQAMQLLSDRVFRSEFAPAEDYDVWERLSSAGVGIASLPKVLTRYRIHEAQVTQRQADVQRAAAWQVQLRQLQRIGLEPDAEQVRLHIGLGLDWGRELRPEDEPAVRRWLGTIVDAYRGMNPKSHRAMNLVARQRLMAFRASARGSRLSRTGSKLLTAIS